MGEKWVETHLSLTLIPFRIFRENPLFSQFKGVEIVSKKGPEAVPTHHDPLKMTILRDCRYGLDFTGWPRFGSVRLRFGDGTVRAVPVFGSGGSSKDGGFLCVSVQFNREDSSGSGFGSWKTVPVVPVPRSVPGKTVPTVQVSGSGSVPGPP